MDQDQLTAAVVAGIVILTSCVGITLSLIGCGCDRLRSNQYIHVSSEDPNLIL